MERHFEYSSRIIGGVASALAAWVAVKLAFHFDIRLTESKVTDLAAAFMGIGQVAYGVAAEYWRSSRGKKLEKQSNQKEDR